MHTLRADKSGTVTLTYLKTSPVNAQLQALYDAQSLDSRLWGKNLITRHQPVDGRRDHRRSCAFSKKPDLSTRRTATR